MEHIIRMSCFIILICGSQYSRCFLLKISSIHFLGREAFPFREGRALENLIPEMDEHAVDLLKVKWK